MEMEYETGSQMLRDIIEDDYDMDSKGGYGRGAFEKQSGFGFPTDFEKLDEYLENLQVRTQQLTSYRDIEVDNYENRFGALIFKTSTSTNKITSKKKSELLKKYAKA